MIDRSVLASAYCIDWIAGDPEWFPHPVRIIGKSVQQGERLLRHDGQSPKVELLLGGVLTLGLVTATYVFTSRAIEWTKRESHWLGSTVETLLAWTCLASRSLHDEALSVVAALEENDITLARHRLARIVGRDTQSLEVHEICRAVIETVAESCADGVVAPLVYMAIGGVPLAMAYKAINTLDSMIGHADERYLYFGKIAARLDDAANFLPSRLTALGITGTALLSRETDAATALATWISDGAKHKSPNSGQPESAMAGALKVKLGGKNFYAGESVESPLIGAEFPTPSLRKTRQAIQIASAVSVLGAIVILLLPRRTR
jgi:adenosylcobinamide-phosphate synthase